MRAKFVNENITFKKGQDPKTTMGIGRHKEIAIEKVARKLAVEYDVTKDFAIDDEDTEYFSAGFDYLGNYYGIGLNPGSEGEYDAIFQDGKFPTDDYKECDTIEEAVETLEGWIRYAEDNQEEEEDNTCDRCGEEIEDEFCEDCYGDDDDEDLDESVNFERGQEPRKTMDIGKDRTLPSEELKAEIFSRIWPKVKDDPIFIDKVSQEEVRQELNSWIETILDAWGVTKPNELRDVHFREYWNDIFVNEGVNFKRGQDPKAAMDIGSEWKIKEVIENVWDRAKFSDWSQTGYPSPKKKDVKNFINGLRAYLGTAEIYDEDTYDLFSSFEEQWAEKYD